MKKISGKTLDKSQFEIPFYNKSEEEYIGTVWTLLNYPMRRTWDKNLICHTDFMHSIISDDRWNALTKDQREGIMDAWSENKDHEAAELFYEAEEDNNSRFVLNLSDPKVLAIAILILIAGVLSGYLFPTI